MERDERVVLRIERLLLDRRRDLRDEVAILRRHAHRDAALVAFEHEPNAAGSALHRAQRRDGADRVKAVGGDLIDVAFLRDCKHAVIRVA